MDFQSAMETFAEAWVAANTHTPLTEAVEAQALALGRPCGDLRASPNDVEMKKENESDGVDNNPRVNANQDGHYHNHNHNKTVSRASTNTGKSIPVHCLVEHVPAPQSCESTGSDPSSSVELDSYAIVPTTTLFLDLVHTALCKLGYSNTDANGAKGAIQIKNWKPLSFDAITDDSGASVGQILGELSTVATLRIRLYSPPKISSANDVKEKLLQLLLTQSQSLLVSAGCPIEEALLRLISKGEHLNEIPEDTRRRFDQWYVQQVLHHRQMSPVSAVLRMVAAGESGAPNGGGLKIVSGSSSSGGGTGGDNGHAAAASIANHEQHVGGGGVAAGSSSLATSSLLHRTRMRTSFDPELELPKLHRWFGENQHPTRLLIQHYVRELNSLESRKGRKPLDVNNVVYWFKNARAAYKRAEQRQGCSSGGGAAPHSPCHDSTSNDNLPPVADRSSPDPQPPGAVRRRPASVPCDSSAASPSDTVRPPCVGSFGGDGKNGWSFRLAHAFKSSTVAPGSDNDNDVGACRGGRRKRSGGGVGQVAVAMDLSTTHRESPPISNGRWKAGELLPETVKSETRDKVRSDDDDEDDLDVADGEEDVKMEESGEPVLVKQEVVDMGTAAVVSATNSSEETDDDEPDDEDDDDVELMELHDRPSPPISEPNVRLQLGNGGNLLTSSSSSLSHNYPRHPAPATFRSNGGQHPHGHHHHHHHHHLSQLQQQQQQQHSSLGGGGGGMLYMHTAAAAGFLPNSSHAAMAAALQDERRKRNRTFIDPVTEVPRLEQWFAFNTHPPHSLILKYTLELNQMTYRQKFPKLEPKNVQFWFKNRRAKCKRLRLSVNLVTSPPASAAVSAASW